jgi:hypothetical protein
VVNRGVGGSFAAAAAGNDPAEIVSVRIQLDAPHGHPLLEALPPFIPVSAGRIPSPRSLEPILEALQSEFLAPSLGHALLVTEILKLLFIEALRVHLLDLAWDDRGWFRALADSQVRASIAAAHRMPLGAVTVAQLASEGERSRRRFGAQFARFTGLKAGTFLRQARARRAAQSCAMDSLHSIMWLGPPASPPARHCAARSVGSWARPPPLTGGVFMAGVFPGATPNPRVETRPTFRHGPAVASAASGHRAPSVGHPTLSGARRRIVPAPPAHQRAGAIEPPTSCPRSRASGRASSVD